MNSMKVVEQWTYKGFNAVIEAKFEKDVSDWDLVYGLRHRDVVHLRLTLYNPIENKEIVRNETAYEYDKVIKPRFFRKDITKRVCLKEDYEEEIVKLKNYAEKYADEQLYNDYVTSGIPDSLNNL